MEGEDEREGQHWWPQETLTLGQAASQGAQPDPRDPPGALTAAARGKEPDKQWTRKINGKLPFLSSTARTRHIFTM